MFRSMFDNDVFGFGPSSVYGNPYAQRSNPVRSCRRSQTYDDRAAVARQKEAERQRKAQREQEIRAYQQAVEDEQMRRQQQRSNQPLFHDPMFGPQYQRNARIAVPPELANHPDFRRLSPRQQQTIVKQFISDKQAKEELIARQRAEREAKESEMEAREKIAKRKPQEQKSHEEEVEQCFSEPGQAEAAAGDVDSTMQDSEASDASDAEVEEKGASPAMPLPPARDNSPEAENLSDNNNINNSNNNNDDEAMLFEDCLSEGEEPAMMDQEDETGKPPDAGEEEEEEEEEEKSVIQTALAQIVKIMSDANAVKEKYANEAFVPRTVENDEDVKKARAFYSEGLLQCVIKLDGIDSHQNMEIRTARKAGVNECEASVDQLKQFGIEHDTV